MKKVQIQDFIDYRYLGSLQVSPDQQHAVFTVITGIKTPTSIPATCGCWIWPRAKHAS